MRRGHRHVTIMLCTSLLMSGTVSTVGVSAAAATSRGATVHPRSQPAHPVAGRFVSAVPVHRTPAPAPAVPHPGKVPAPTTLTATLGADGAWSRIGAAGIALARSGGAGGAVTVQVLDPAAVARLHLTGLVLRVRPSGADGAISVSVPTSLLTGIYGADYASRARWFALSGCGRTTCASGRFLRTRRTAATDALPTARGTALPGALPAPAGGGTIVATAPSTSSPFLLTTAAAANAASGSGDSSATSLSPSSQWNVSPQTGDFSWSYPLRLPPSAAGPSPSMAIAYDSNSINGRTGSTNNQPSQVGEGFELSGGGYVERSYVPCSQAGISNSGDLCWKADNATLSLAGHSSTLVVSSSGTWKLAGDDDTKVEHLSGNTTLCSNGTYDNDCWRLTTTDGTQYYFGRNHLPGWTSTATPTNSTWTVPVCGTASSPCGGSATTATPFNTQAWRWNLDYVVDLHGNSEAFYYAAESNRYAEKSSTTASVSYVRGGYLKRVDYGMHAGFELTKNAPQRVVLTPANRCETGVSGEPSGACTTVPPSTTNAQYWPDVPWNDFYCNSTTCSGKTSPTFWSSQRLATVATQYLSGTTYASVDSWALTPKWPDPGDTTTASLTLDSIAHSGLVGGTVALPATRFDYAMEPNRVAPPTGVVPLEKPRLVGITTEEGAYITVDYLDTDCAGSSPATPETNTKRCFPQYWAPPGGSLFLDWFRIYPVAAVIADPRTGGAVDLPDQTFYDYSVGKPAYRLDTSPLTRNGQRTWSAFAGYDEVRVEHGDRNSPTTLRTTDYTYLRGLDGDVKDATGARRSVSVIAGDGTTVADSPWWAGQAFEEVVHDGLGGAVVSDTVTTPWASSATLTGVSETEKVGTSGSGFTNVPTARHTGTSTTATYEPLSTGGTRTTGTDNAFDSYGRVVKAAVLGDAAAPTDDRCTVTSFVDNTGKNILNLADEVNTYAGSCSALPADPATATISDVRTTYDGLPWGSVPTLGDVTAVQEASSFTGTTATWLTTATNAYDAIGRRLSTTDAMSRVVTTAYAPAAPAAGGSFTDDVGPVTQVTTTDPMNFAKVETVNPAWGSVTTVKDVNSNVATTAYDALGRVTGVWTADRPQATNPTPTVGYAYTITPGSPVVVASTTLTPTGGTETSYTSYDGLLRLRQTQFPAEAGTYNAAPGTGGATVNETVYDFAGQATTSYGPYLISAAPSAALFVPAAYGNIPGSAGASYDGAGRRTASITYAYGVEQWRTATAYAGADRTDVTPPLGGTPTTTYTDASGHVTALLQWHGPAIGDVSNPAASDRTSYTYAPTGRMATLTDQAGEQWSWGYDTLGRVTDTVDPDAGTTHYTFDADDERRSTTDADGTTLWYSYDAEGRQTAVNQDSGTGPLLAAWHYDGLAGGKGLLDSTTSYVGSTAASPGTAYTKSITGYDAAGRPLGTTVSLPADVLYPGAAPYSYTTSATYNADGSMATTTEPGAGGVPAETLRYTYTSLGRLYSVVGAKQYLASTGYDGATGLVTGLARDNGVYRLSDTYTYTAGTLRLARVQTTTAASSNNLVADISYGYDDAGDVTAIADAPSGSAADHQCFRYDSLQRLTQAWTPGSGDCGTAPSSAALGGPAPYWQDYGYTANGNRASVLNHATVPTGTDEKDTYAYPQGPNAARPHAVLGVTHATAPAGTATFTVTGTDSYGYDGIGQTTDLAGDTLTWTPRGRVQTIRQPSGATQSRVYDADGNLLVTTDPTNGTTAYLGDTELHVPAGSTAVTGQRIYSAQGQVVAVRSGAGTLAWLDTDPHGTANVAESFSNGAVTVRRFDPFGNPRGTAASWPEDRGFLNKPVDPFSSLTSLGAREYAPNLGRFISVDPLLDTFDPQSVNGYGYADDNPVDGSDPDGLCVKIDSASTPCLTATQSAYPTYTNSQISGFHDQHGNPVGGKGCGAYCGGGDQYSRPMNNTQAAHWNGGGGGYDPYRKVTLHTKAPPKDLPGPRLQVEYHMVCNSMQQCWWEKNPDTHYASDGYVDSAGHESMGMEMAGGLISRLPTGGQIPFRPKKGQSLGNPKSISRQSGYPVDKDGRIWQWDPVKGEWDVQHPDGTHTNVGPDGNITHGKGKTAQPAGEPGAEQGDTNSYSIPNIPPSAVMDSGLMAAGGLAIIGLLFGLAPQ